jgi:pimeloyl-ACP methyl ester carboxylesterase
MERVISTDGTAIAFERMGAGPAVILVGGGLDDGSENAPLMSELAQRFTVFNYARRGRGESGDTPPYAVQREIEDLQALVAEAGGSAHLYGVSSGGMFALEAAMAGLAVDRIAVYDVPYDAAPDSGPVYDTYRDRLSAALSDGRRDDAVDLFMRLAGSSDEDIRELRTSPYWPGLEALSHTLAYDAACYGPPPIARLRAITQPTLVLTGGIVDPNMGELQPGFFDAAADILAATIPNANRQIVAGQSHVADPTVVAPMLIRFFAARIFSD